MMIEVSGEDLHKQLLHINRNLRKGSKLIIEVYENLILLVYKDMEYPVRVINPIINSNKPLFRFELKKYTLFLNIIKKNSKAPTFKLDFHPDYIELNIGKTNYRVE